MGRGRFASAVVLLAVAAACTSDEPRATSTSPSPTASSPSASPSPSPTSTREPRFREFAVPAGSRPHDVAPAADGTVWYTGQNSAEMGRLDPATGRVKRIPLGRGARPHGVIVGPDGAAWVTDGGLNAIVRVDAQTEKVTKYPLPASAADANLNTAAFDGNGILWFTGQAGFYGRLDPATGRVQTYEAPQGAGPYGIDATPDGTIYYASLAGDHIARIDSTTGKATVIEPPTRNQGARRVWSDSKAVLWVSEWNVGQLGRFDPRSNSWKEWKLPGSNPMAYAVYVDDRDIIWLTDFTSNAIVRFDQTTERFQSFPLPTRNAQVRQLLGRPGELWGAESSADKLVVLLT